MNFFIVSGLSGSGKSIALQALEDLGYYCIDNLPAILLPAFTDKLLTARDQELENCAVGIDSRNRGFLEALPTTLEDIGQRGLGYKILFLEAEESVLIKRYSETRRKHPLTDSETALIEGIRGERELLFPLRTEASRVIDTSHMAAQELRRMVREFSSGAGKSRLTLLFESFGYKHGAPLNADFVFDVRCIPNPYWNTSLRHLTGKDPKVIRFLEDQDDTPRMITDIKSFLVNWLPQFGADNRTYITVAIGCTGGQHRSVYIADALTALFENQDLNVQVRHR